MKELILVRHGEAQHHVKDITGGWTDTSLTERGKRQVERLGPALSFSEQRRAQLFSSDLLRARQTADAISETIGIRPVLRADLRELNNGLAKDISLAEAESLLLPITEPPLEWVPYPEAESWKDMSHRLISCMDELASQTTDETVVVVSHANAMVAIVHWWLGLGEEHWSRISFEFEPASITKLTVNDWGEKAISRLNDTSHLRGI